MCRAAEIVLDAARGGHAYQRRRMVLLGLVHDVESAHAEEGHITIMRSTPTYEDAGKTSQLLSEAIRAGVLEPLRCLHTSGSVGRRRGGRGAAREVGLDVLVKLRLFF